MYDRGKNNGYMRQSTPVRKSGPGRFLRTNKNTKFKTSNYSDDYAKTKVMFDLFCELKHAVRQFECVFEQAHNNINK